MKALRFGIEIETVGLKRDDVAKAIATVVGGWLADRASTRRAKHQRCRDARRRVNANPTKGRLELVGRVALGTSGDHSRVWRTARCRCSASVRFAPHVWQRLPIERGAHHQHCFQRANKVRLSNLEASCAHCSREEICGRAVVVPLEATPSTR